MVVLHLLFSVALSRTWELNGEKAWQARSDEYRDMKANNDDEWKSVDKTVCYSGNDLYESKRVYCDAECIHDHGDSAICNGPWYCSKTRVCQEFRRPRGHDLVDPEDRECVIVRSCANHSQCFPSEAEAKAEGIVLDYDEWDSKGDWTRRGYTVKYGGMKMNTVCCRNRRRFKIDKNLPCNGAASLRLPQWAWFLPSTLAVFLWWMRGAPT